MIPYIQYANKFCEPVPGATVCVPGNPERGGKGWRRFNTLGFGLNVRKNQVFT